MEQESIETTRAENVDFVVAFAEGGKRMDGGAQGNRSDAGKAVAQATRGEVAVCQTQGRGAEQRQW